MVLDELLHASRQGDDESFRLLWRHFQPRLLRYLRLLAGWEAEDLASETWVQVVRELGGFRGDAESFAAWLFTIARRCAVDAHRRRARRPTVVADLSEEVLRAGDHPAAEDVVLGTLSTDAALALLATLPDDQRDAVALTVLADLSAPEAARVLGTSAGALRVRAHRGLRRLQAQLETRTPELSA